ncbi:MAG TPA: hypothetical protein VKZ49_17660 [Polyangiaceae bacterium]|nr:hypothetical protein [Polyangiaceae bacterium]
MALDDHDDGPDAEDGSAEEVFFLPIVPPELEIEPLLLAVLHCAAFLDLAGEESVDEQDAGDVLEHIGMYVQRLPAPRLAELEQQLVRLQEHGKKASWPEPLVEFIADFLYNCGIGEDDDD